MSLYQHHISTFTVLLSLYLLLRTRNLWSLLIIWFLFAAGITIDYPNLFFMFPIALFALGRIIIPEITAEKTRIKIQLLGMLTFVGAIFPLVFFLWFNQNSYGNPLQFSGTVKRVSQLTNEGTPVLDTNINTGPLEKLQPEEKKSAVAFFQPRRLLNGFYVHFFESFF